MTTAVMSLIDSDNYKSKLFGDDTNSFRSVSPTSSINKQSYSTSPISLKLLSKKRFRDEEDMFADIIRIESSTEISDQADAAEHREICKGISLSLFESRKMLCSAPSSNNLKEYCNDTDIVNDIFSNFIKDMVVPNIDKTNNCNDATANLNALNDFLSSDNIWSDIYVLEQERK